MKSFKKLMTLVLGALLLLNLTACGSSSGYETLLKDRDIGHSNAYGDGSGTASFAKDLSGGSLTVIDVKMRGDVVTDITRTDYMSDAELEGVDEEYKYDGLQDMVRDWAGFYSAFPYMGMSGEVYRNYWRTVTRAGGLDQSSVLKQMEEARILNWDLNGSDTISFQSLQKRLQSLGYIQK